MLSIFLTILDEHQGYVRNLKQELKELGDAPPEYGIITVAGRRFQTFVQTFRKAMAGNNAAEAEAAKAGAGPAVEGASAKLRASAKARSTLKRTSVCISKLKSACRDSSSALARGSDDEPHTTHQSHAVGLGDVASLVMGAGASSHQASSHQSVKQAVAEALADAGIGTGAQGGELREAIDALRAALDGIERLQPDHKGPRGYPQSPGSDASDGGASRSGRRRSSAPKRRVRRGSSQESGTSTTFEV